MQSFIDETVIEISSGDGGAGAVSFRREKYVPNGGPDGGDGGAGGDLVFITKNNLKTLYHLNNKKKYKASNGQAGMGRRRHGKNGDTEYIAVPPGTMIRDFDSDEILHDFDQDIENEEWIAMKGGQGGQGNWHFRTARRQAPRFAQPGIEGESRKVRVELNIIADFGFVGFPSVGKSSLLRHLTNANPKVAPYPFTTKIPNLGVLNLGGKDIVLADIPGIIEGASEGAGLGFRFLKHISRTEGLVYLIDLSSDNVFEQYDKLRTELKRYNPALLDKKSLIVATKTDLDEGSTVLADLRKTFTGQPVIGVSVFTDTGFKELKQEFLKMAR